VQCPLGTITAGGFSRQRGFDPLQAAGGWGRLAGTTVCRVRSIAPHDGYRNFAILHETPPMQTARGKASASALSAFLAIPFRTWPRRVAIKTERATHLLFGVIHWRRRGRRLRLFPRQAHALALIRIWF
jgi:hypothetical protein